MWKWVASWWQERDAGAGRSRTAAAVPGTAAERRHVVRFLSGAEVFWHPAPNGDRPRSAARVRDVSLAGISLAVDRPLQPGTLLELERPGPAGQPLVRILSCVRHLGRLAPEGWSLGCSFIRELSEPELQALL